MNIFIKTSDPRSASIAQMSARKKRKNTAGIATSVFMAATILLAGCASISPPYWQKDRVAYQLVGVVRVATDDELRTRCNYSLTRDLWGCTILKAESQQAWILMGPRADQCTLEHEKAHVAGWSHDSRETFSRDCGPAGI